MGGPFSFPAAVAGSTVDQVVSTRPAGGLVLSQARPGPGPGRDGRAGGHAPWSCHPGCGLVGGPGAWAGAWGVAWCWTVVCRWALVGGSLLLVRVCFRCRTPSDLHVCMLTDIWGVNRGWWWGFLLAVFGLVGGCFGGVQALCLVGCVSDRPPEAVAWPSVPGTYASRIAGTRASHPGQGERPDRGPDHYRGPAQGETHPEAGATPTQDHGPEEALRSHPGRCHSGGWEDRMDYEASAPSRGPATGSRMRRWPGTMEQGATLVVGRSGLDPPPRP